MRLKTRNLIVSLILVACAIVALSGRPAAVTPAPACARYYCESCYNNVTEDESTKLDNCNSACASAGAGPGCDGRCWNAYNTGRCAQMRALCPRCAVEQAVACGVEN